MIDNVGFDITSILDFHPPSYLCPACRGLIDIKLSWVGENPHRQSKYSCPVCNVEYVQEDRDSSDPWDGPSIYDHFRSNGWVIDHKDLFAHATTLAQVVKKSRSRRPSAPQRWPTARTFFEAISRAVLMIGSREQRGSHWPTTSGSHSTHSVGSPNMLKAPAVAAVDVTRRHAAADGGAL